MTAARGATVLSVILVGIAITVSSWFSIVWSAGAIAPRALALIVDQVTVAVLCVVALGFFARAWPADYGFGRIGSRSSDAVLGVLICCVALPFAYWLATRGFRDFFLIQPDPAAFSQWKVPNQATADLYFVIGIGLIAPLKEEAIYRALPWFYLVNRFPGRNLVPLYIVGTSTVFALAHWWQGSWAIFGAFVFGLLAAFLYSHLRNAWPLVAGHAITNVWNYLAS
jgi:membrane protease YdiL (CAAX protease family)